MNNIPRATYRLQFHEGFTFDHAIEILPYLDKLGISHVYASPITQARPGSTHGYDIVDPSKINPELGGDEGFARFSDALRARGMGLIIDIVPNHMGVGGSDNPAWLSVLEWGELSPFANTFDIDWLRHGAGGNLVVPFLGDRYGVVLEAGQLQLKFDADEGSFSVWHWDNRFPISPLSYPGLLDRALVALTGIEKGAELLSVAEALRAMADETDIERRAQFPAETESCKAKLAALGADAEIREAIERALALINGIEGSPESFGALHRLLEGQNYRLAYWRVAASDINYRRFFDINSLGGIRVEDPVVLARTHELIFRLVREARVQGLRIDHIDGLADPAGYAAALQKEIGPDFYILVEKILEPGEDLRPWPIAGTTGYEQLNLIDGIFVEPKNAKRFDRIYRGFSEIDTGYGTQLRAAKEEITETAFVSELEVLVSDLKRIAEAEWSTRDYTTVALRRALVEMIARLPVYRTYINDEADDLDRKLLLRTTGQAKRWSTLPDRSVHEFILVALLGRLDTAAPGRALPEEVARFRRRFQQLGGPVMAKSLEDTLFYRYARLISLNEVGGDPDHFGTPPDAFHQANAARAQNWPHAMTATATHDTKRGEDARARLHVLSEIPDEWAKALDIWEELAAPYLGESEGVPVPDRNDQYMILQSVLGAWPLEWLDGDDANERAQFLARIKAWAEKALREAKRYTSWVNTDEDFERAVAGFLDNILSPESGFHAAFKPLAARISVLGAWNGLTRTVLKCTLPGVPDIYQGTEFWDFSLVDPDNRRPVDYKARGTSLDATRAPKDLLSDWRSGAVKQSILARLLADRAASPGLYTDGSYTPLAVEGDKAEHILAFTRSDGQETLAVIVPRLVAGLANEAGDVPPAVWAETSITLPPGRWRDVLSDVSVESAAASVPLASILQNLPLAVLRLSK
jgi:(1->4)-alpha-D-glucan 1-alpha-D-glucosylmutase